MKAVTFNNARFLFLFSFAPSQERHLEPTLIFPSMTCVWNYSEMHSKLTAPLADPSCLIQSYFLFPDS